MDETMMEQTGNTQEKVQGLNIVMNGITINGPMFDIHDNHHVVINATSSSQGEVNGSAMSAAPSPRADAKRASVATVARYESATCDEESFSSPEECALAPLGLSPPEECCLQP